AELVTVPGEATRALDAHTFPDVLEDLLVARLVADDEQPKPVVLEDLQRLAVDVRPRVRRPGDPHPAEPLGDVTGARRIGGGGVVVEEELLHLREAPPHVRHLLEDVADTADPVRVAGRDLRPEAERAAGRAAAAGVERDVRVL